MYRSRRDASKSEKKSNRKRDSSPSRDSVNRMRYEASPVRNFESRKYGLSSSRERSDRKDNENWKRIDMSPLRLSFRSKREKESPSRGIIKGTTTWKYDTTPARLNSRPERGQEATEREGGRHRIRQEYDVSPLRISFRTRKEKKSPARDTSGDGILDSKRFGRVYSSPAKDFLKTPARSRRLEESPAGDTIRSRRFDASPAGDYLRSRRRETSPVKESSGREGLRFRRSSPSPSRSKNRENKLDSYLGGRNLDYAPPSPRLGVRAVNYGRLPLRELPPTTTKSSQSYRISCTSRDDDSDLEYLTKVREILLGEPIKGNTQQPAQILPHMYIGNQSNAESLRLLRKLGITHVLNCAGFKGPRKNPDANPYEGLDIEYCEFKADDRDGYDMSQHFDAAFRYLDNAKRTGGTCLVHCALGINRSGITVVAYLMIYSKWPLLKAVEFVKKKRGVVLSNHGFQRQLIRFARQQSLLEPLPERATKRSESPGTEQNFVKSLYQAQYGHWGNALDEMKRKPIEEYTDHAATELGSGPESAIMYRYARFMNRDKV